MDCWDVYMKVSSLSGICHFVVFLHRFMSTILLLLYLYFCSNIFLSIFPLHGGLVPQCWSVLTYVSKVSKNFGKK